MTHNKLYCALVLLISFVSLLGCNRSGKTETTENNEQQKGNTDISKVASTETPQSNESNAPVTSAPSKSIAIIDLTAIGDQTGINDQIRLNANIKKQEADRRYKQLVSKLEKEYNDTFKSYGDSPTEDQTKLLLELDKKNRKQLDDEWINLQNEVTNYHNMQKIQFWNAVKPVALGIANAKGYSVVMRADGVFHYNKNDEITSFVVKKMLQEIQRAKESTAEASPKLEDGGQFSPTLNR